MPDDRQKAITKFILSIMLRNCSWSADHPAIVARVGKTSREAVLKMLVSSPFDSRLSIMEHLQGLFALLQLTGTDGVPPTEDEIYRATQQVNRQQQGIKRVWPETLWPEKRQRHDPASLLLLKNTTQDAIFFTLWNAEIRLALLRRNKPLKVWTTKARLQTLKVKGYKKVVSKAKLRKVKAQAKVEEEVKRKIKGQSTMKKGSNHDSKQKRQNEQDRLAGTKDAKKSNVHLATSTIEEMITTAQKTSNATGKPQAKVRPAQTKDQVELVKVPKHDAPYRKRKCDTFQDDEQICDISPKKVTITESTATKPDQRYKYIKENASTTRVGSIAEWLRPKTVANNKSKGPQISTNPARTVICLRPQDRWMSKSEPISTHSAESRTVCLRPQDRWMSKSEPTSTHSAESRIVCLRPQDRWCVSEKTQAKSASLRPYDKCSKVVYNNKKPAFTRPQDRWSC